MAAADMYVTAAGAGDKSGSSWANAMDLAAWLNDLTNNAEAGDRYFLMGGQTYTLTGNHDSTAKNGTRAEYIEIIGVASGTAAEPPTFADWASGADRPLIAAGANDYILGEYHLNVNISCTFSAGDGLYANDYSVFTNCKSVNTAGSNAIRANGYGCLLINCEASSPNGNAFRVGNGTRGFCAALGCYAYDSSVGFTDLGSGDLFAFCVADTCTTGIWATYRARILNSTIYGSTTAGISSSAARYDLWILNNIIDSCLVGIALGSAGDSQILDYNDYHNNGTDVTNATKGPNATAVDPGFVDAANGNFFPKNWAILLGFPGIFPGGLSNGAGLIRGAVQPRRAQMPGPFVGSAWR